MGVSSAVVAHVVVMGAVVPAGIAGVVVRLSEIVMVVVGVPYVYPEVPVVPVSIDRTVKVVDVQEAAVLTRT